MLEIRSSGSSMALKFLDVTCKQHEAFKSQAVALLDLVGELNLGQREGLGRAKGFLEEVFCLSMRIGKLLEDAARIFSADLQLCDSSGKNASFLSNSQAPGRSRKISSVPKTALKDFKEKTGKLLRPSEERKSTFSSRFPESSLFEHRKEQSFNKNRQKDDAERISACRFPRPSEQDSKDLDSELVKTEPRRKTKEASETQKTDSFVFVKNEFSNQESNSQFFAKQERQSAENSSPSQQENQVDENSSSRFAAESDPRENRLVILPPGQGDARFRPLLKPKAERVRNLRKTFSKSSHQPLHRKLRVFRPLEFGPIDSRRLHIDFQARRIEKRQRGQYRICPVEIKEEAIRLAQLSSIREAAELLGIPEKNIKRWLKNGPERKKGAGRKTTDPKMENQLLNWIIEEYQRAGIIPDCRDIKFQAKLFSSNDDFKASKGWCDKFMRRNSRLFKCLEHESGSRLVIQKPFADRRPFS